MTQKGRAYSRHHLAKQVRQVLRQAGVPDSVQLRDLRRTASVERADGGATAYELASGTGHSIGTSQQILDTYNPRSYDAAKSAQEKRKEKKKRTKNVKKFESHRPKSLKALAGKS